jgi:hypothetical protein
VDYFPHIWDGGIERDGSWVKRACMRLLRRNDAAGNVERIVIRNMMDIHHIGVL